MSKDGANRISEFEDMREIVLLRDSLAHYLTVSKTFLFGTVSESFLKRADS
jgi:hypothetical protein